MLATARPHIHALSQEDLKQICCDHRIPSSQHSAQQAFREIYRNFTNDFSKFQDFNKTTAAFFQEHFVSSLPQIRESQISSDGTIKFLMELNAEKNQTVETVLIPAAGRRTLCVSCQVGCTLDCKFCLTGQSAFKKNLTAAEIVGQYLAVSRWLTARGETSLIPGNIVFMGQGEPLHNLKNIMKAIEILTDPHGAQFSRKKITLSTAGVAPAIPLLNNYPQTNLSVSLHATTDAVRNLIMPINEKYPLAELFQAIGQLQPRRAGWKISYSYLLLDGVNDSDQDALNLIALLPKENSKVNLLTYNDFPTGFFQASPPARQARFWKILVDHQVICNFRQSRGPDISAACGQLQSAKN